MAKRGGKRQGAGRPKGSGNLSLRDYLKQSDIQTFIEFLLANYMEDSRLMIWMPARAYQRSSLVVIRTTPFSSLTTLISFFIISD
jgi:hypothetical protein